MTRNPLYVYASLLVPLLFQFGCVEPDPTGIGAHLSNKQAESAFRRLGGQIQVLAKSQERLAVSLRMYDQEVPIEALRVARSFWRVYRLEFVKCTLPPIWLQAIPTFTDTRQLVLREMALSDEEIAPILQGQHIETIQLFDLTETYISDRSLELMSKQASRWNLRQLGLARTKVSDTGLKHLVDLKRLKQVYLSGTQVTESGVQWLQSQRPQLQIDWAPESVEDPMQPSPEKPNN